MGFNRFVEIGRLAYVAYVAYVAVIVDVIDQNRALVDGHIDESLEVARDDQEVVKIPAGARIVTLMKAWK